MIREGEQRKLAAILLNDSYADWNPDQEPVHTDFVDRALAAAIAVLKGETYYPRLPKPE